MRPFGPAQAEASSPLFPGAAEAAPARNRVRLLAIGIFAVLLLLAGRAVQLAFSGDPLAAQSRASAASTLPRGDIVDRNGVLLATTVRAYALTATPSRVWDAPAIADALRGIFPDLDRATIIRRLTDTSRDLIYLRRGLTPDQRDRVHALGLAGIGFETEHHREYPQGASAGHVLGFTDVDLNALSGVERGLDAQIRAAGESGGAVRLSLDMRIQYALEEELDAAARAAGASGGAAIVLDGRTGETLALASWPVFNPNQAGQATEDQRRDRAAGDLHELGSTVKPFTVAIALQEGLTNPGELFDLARPLVIETSTIEDHEPHVGMSSLREILAHSSNVGAAQLALRTGGARQRAYLERLGLTSASGLELGRDQAPLAPQTRSRRDVAGVGFGYGIAATPATLAGAYTLFANNGQRVRPTLLALASDAAITRTQVFSPEVTRQVLTYMRATVTDGTGRAADVPGLMVAGKTGTAEKLTGADGYDESRNFSSFAGVFPANAPRYIIVLALDDTGEGAAGGMVAAPAVGRTLRRIAPMLGLRVEARAPTR
ncbi:penicillin-binding protein 2 [Terricaulis sp.]|uniref:peptidoglycan D,D-transpeptidase FtsI family protein n=1 Tax=Terricaulis sp. TaxID=2768686 RepID=UPI002AC56443|nr:penicillin-binding protein 2 [Terricaulis sp.]MDZ4692756.1 penicillin-binding protein 2 [Terricaulis sp.]